MRILGNTAPNTLTIHDKISNENLDLQYKTPSTSERVKYASKILKRLKNGKYEIDIEFKLEAGASILVGIGENQFADENGDPISSNPGSSNYSVNWKKLIIDNAPELLAILAENAFDNAQIVQAGEADELPLENCLSDISTDVLTSEKINV